MMRVGAGREMNILEWSDKRVMLNIVLKYCTIHRILSHPLYLLSVNESRQISLTQYLQFLSDCMYEIFQFDVRFYISNLIYIVTLILSLITFMICLLSFTIFSGPIRGDGYTISNL